MPSIEEIRHGFLPVAMTEDPALSDTVTDREYHTVGRLQSEHLTVRDGLVYIDAQDPILSLSGLTLPKDNNGEYYRLDAFRKEDYRDGPRLLAEETSGVTIRFCTNADAFVLKASMRNVDTIEQNPLFPPVGAVGFDVYVGRGTHSRLIKTIMNPEGFTEEIPLPDGYQDVTVVFPVYAGVTEVSVGLPVDALIAKSTARRYGTVVFYGSSIVQGACVEHPGGTYVNTLCRMIDAECRNLGFSGNALGEQVMAEYIASIGNVTAFVLDYDWNAYHAEHLRMTHYAFYQTVRAAYPKIPIIMMTRPVFTEEGSEEDRIRRAVIRDSYEKAIAAGDTNVYFLSGGDFYRDVLGRTEDSLCMSDGIHPSDSGHYYMANAVYRVLKPLLDER